MHVCYGQSPEATRHPRIVVIGKPLIPLLPLANYILVAHIVLGSLETVNSHPRIVLTFVSPFLWSIPNWPHTYFRVAFSPGRVNFSNNGQSLAGTICRQDV